MWVTHSLIAYVLTFLDMVFTITSHTYIVSKIPSCRQGLWYVALTQFFVAKFYLCRKQGETAHMPVSFLYSPLVPHTSLLSAHRLTRISFEWIFLNLSTGIDKCHYTQPHLHRVPLLAHRNL